MVRALRSHRKGRRFDSYIAHHPPSCIGLFIVDSLRRMSPTNAIYLRYYSQEGGPVTRKRVYGKHRRSGKVTHRIAGP